MTENQRIGMRLVVLTLMTYLVIALFDTELRFFYQAF